MTSARFQEVIRIVRKLSNDDAIFEHVEENVPQPYVIVKPERLLTVCQFMHEYPKLFFDSLSCISAMDNGLGAAKRFEVIYHLYSLLNEEGFVIKVFADVDLTGKPTVPSLTSIWKTADWHEREAYDLMGIQFENHPDPRRILLPADWIGHPLRKDYAEQETYHGIKVKYE